MKRFFYILLFCPMTTYCIAQDGYIDSLRMILGESANRDSMYILTLLEAGLYFESVQLDSSSRYYEQALVTSQSLPSIFLEGKTISWYTDVLNKQGQLNRALELNRRGIDIGRQLAHDRLWVASLTNLANTYQYTAQYDSCLFYQLEAIPVLERLGDSVFLSQAFNNISGTYQLLRQFDEARMYANKGLGLALAIDNAVATIACYFSLGIIENQDRHPDRALTHFEKAQSLARKEGLAYEEGVACLNLAEQYQDLEAFDQALQWLDRGVALLQLLGEKEILARLLYLQGDVFLDLGQITEASVKLRQALDTSHVYQIEEVKKLSCQSMSYVALLSGDRKAYRMWRDSAIALEDALLNENVFHLTTQWEARYKTTLKEEEILRLQQIRDLHQLKLKNRNVLVLGLVGIVLLLGVMGYITVLNIGRKKKLTDQQLRIREQTILNLQQEKQLAVSNALLQGQEKERSRLAKDLHDGLGGMLSGIKQSLSAMKGNQIITENGVYSLNQVIEDMDQSIRELRHIARNMMPEALIRFGLVDALQDYCTHLRQVSGLNISFQSLGMDVRLTAETEIIIFRIAQELLNNALKHSEAHQVIVQLSRHEQVVSLTVEDDGKGFDPATDLHSKGSGWNNIRSRVEYLKGHIDLRSKPGEGVSVHITFDQE